MPNFTSRDEAITRLIVEPIEATGEATREEYDIDAIAEAVLMWDDAYDGDRNVYMLDRQGFRLLNEFAPEDPADESGATEAFWAVVEANAL